MFWNWVGKVDHNFSAQRPGLLPLGRERAATRSATAATPSAAVPAQDGQLPLFRANRALVGDWVHIFGAGTVFNLRGSYTYFLEWSHSTRRVRLRCDRVLAGEPRQPAAQRQAIGGLFPRIELDQFAPLSRGSEPEPEPELLAPAERVADPRRAQHPQRPRHALDQRLQRELQQRRRRWSSSTATSPAAR